MTSRLDPRADLVAPVFDHRAFHSRPRPTVSDHAPRRSSVYSLPPAAYPKKKPCYDWIFSTASNVHIAVDRSAFKNYTPFRSYVLAVADQRQVTVKGIGTVELKVRRQAGSKDTHRVILENVLHIPTWLCNIMSDVHFVPAPDFEHNWSEFGVNFQQQKDGKWKPWGYTENFCGLDKIVLAKYTHGRSPMLEDKDREVFSVNITWPQHQRDKFGMLLDEQQRRFAELQERKAKTEVAKEQAREDTMAQDDQSGEKKAPFEVHELSASLPAIPKTSTAPRSALTAVDPNLKRAMRTSSLRVPGNSAFREALPWRKSVEQ